MLNSQTESCINYKSYSLRSANSNPTRNVTPSVLCGIGLLVVVYLHWSGPAMTEQKTNN